MASVVLEWLQAHRLIRSVLIGLVTGSLMIGAEHGGMWGMGSLLFVILLAAWAIDYLAGRVEDDRPTR